MTTQATTCEFQKLKEKWRTATKSTRGDVAETNFLEKGATIVAEIETEAGATCESAVAGVRMTPRAGGGAETSLKVKAGGTMAVATTEEVETGALLQPRG